MGIYLRDEAFFAAADGILASETNKKDWCILSVQLENFKLFGEWYGNETQEKLTAEICECLRLLTEQTGGAAAFFGGGEFAVLMPYDEVLLAALYREIAALPKRFCEENGFLPAFGICEAADSGEGAVMLYSYAELARRQLKGNYRERMKKFQPEQLAPAQHKYELLSAVKKALKTGEITFYLQPRCNMETGRIVGAEALVRWNSRQRGVIAPSAFLPALEESGFITGLDRYLWEEVCKWQRSMADRGRRTVPVSVNLSAADLFFMDVPAVFHDLLEQYDLTPNLLLIEITEPVFAEENEFIFDVITKLREDGFRVAIDDFTSRYSSLNMLRDVEADELKLDMRFLNIEEGKASRNSEILGTVANMARLTGINITAEGVETEEQKQFLLNMGCTYGQGYYFYRPLPITEWEALLENPEKFAPDEYHARRDEDFSLKELLSEELLRGVVFPKLLGAVAVYEVEDYGITVRGYNEEYASMMQIPAFSFDEQLRFREHFHSEDYDTWFQMFDRAQARRDEGAECDVRRIRQDGSILWIHLRTFYVSRRHGRRFYYSAIADVTELHEKNEKLFQRNRFLDFLNNDMPGGYYCHENNAEYDFMHISKRFLELVGYTKEEIELRFRNKFRNMIHPDDREPVRLSMENLEQTGGNCAISYRIHSKSGYMTVYDQSRMVDYNGHRFFQGIILCDMDYYRQVQDLENENGALSIYNSGQMPCGIFQSEVDGAHQFTYISNSMLAMLGYSREEFRRKFHNTTEYLIWKEDRKRVSAEVREQIARGSRISLEYRIEMADGSLKWVYSCGRMTVDAQGKRWFYVCLTDYSYLKEKYRENEWKQMKYKTLAEIPGTIVYDYDPFLDRFTMEIAMEDGRIETLVTEQFVEHIDSHSWLSPEGTKEQRESLQAASLMPMAGTSEFQSRFLWDSDYHAYRSHYRSLADEDGIVYRIVGRADNIDQEKKMLSDLQDLSRKDSMTNLLNNRSAKETLSEAIQEFYGGMLFLLDIDNFKQVNASLGIAQGDELLKQVAGAIESTFQKQDIQSRFGTDVFLIFMPGIFDKEVAAFKAQELLRKTEEIRLADGGAVRCSIGIAVAENKTCTVENLIHRADLALYRAKRDSSRHAFFAE